MEFIEMENHFMLLKKNKLLLTKHKRNKGFRRHRKSCSFGEQRQNYIMAFKKEKVKNKDVTLAWRYVKDSALISLTHLI